MQPELFDDLDADADPVDDPYADTWAAARRIAAKYTVSEERAFDLILGFGSESRALAHMMHLWWMYEVEVREPPQAA